MDNPDSTPPDEKVLSAQIIERLLHHDELDDDQLAELEANPAARTELHRLQLAEAWLTEPFTTDESTADASTPACPSAEDLFDFGQKLEPTELSHKRQVELTEHIEHCSECAALIATLAERPPSPLIVVDSPLPERHPEPSPRPRSSRAIHLARGPRRIDRSGLRHVPFLVAASLLAVLVLSGWPKSVIGKAPTNFPTAAVMRGSTSLGLVTPRNLVLSRSRDLPGLPRLSLLPFEVRPVPGAARYDFYVYPGNSSALQRGEERPVLHHITGSEPTLHLAGPLPTGRYSWEAWAVREIDGIPEFLGEMNFRVVSDPDLETELIHLGEGIDAVCRLEYGHYYADARQLARHLMVTDGCDPDEAADYLAVPPIR